MDFETFVGKGSAVIILFNKKHEILLQLRDEHAPTAPLMWSFFGGGCDGDETPFETVFRECKEELNYDLKNPELCLARHHLKHPLFDTDFIFVQPFPEEDLGKITQHEGKDMGWFTLEEAKKLDMVVDKKVLLPAIFGYIECYYPKE
jgi:8-oxo-dGTP pyrophosphatase MutT (NUDIX family)